MSNPSEPLLADIINDRKGTRSYARLSRDAGGYPTANRFQQLATVRTQNQFPSPDTLLGIMRAMNVPMTEIVMAAARSVGLPIPPEDPTVLVIAGAGVLSPEAKDLLLSMARDMIRAQSGDTGGMHVVRPEDVRREGEPDDDPPETLLARA